MPFLPLFNMQFPIASNGLAPPTTAAFIPLYPAFFPCSSMSSLSATRAMNSPLVGLSFLP